jgi:hypothetical protein
MKRPQPDIYGTTLSKYIAQVGGIRKLRRLWGVETVNGIEVLTQRQYYYRPYLRLQPPAKYEKLFRYLGAYEDLEDAEMDGVSSAWFYFNKNNATSLGALPNANEDFVTTNLNKLWWDPADGSMPAGLTLTTSFVIEAKIARQAQNTGLTLTNILDPDPLVMSEAARITAVVNNYEALWDTCHIEQQGVGVINKGTITDAEYNTVTPDEDDLTPNDPWLAAITVYALRTNGIPATVKSVEIGLGKIINGQRYPTYIVTLEIPYVVVTSSTAMVEDIAADITFNYNTRHRSRVRHSYPNGYWIRKGIRALNSDDLEDNLDVVSRLYTFWEDAADADSYDSLWVNYPLGSKNWYLKSEPFTNPGAYGLKFQELNDYVLPLLDTGYKKKSVSFWKKLIAVVVFVIAVIWTFYTFGQDGGAALKGAALYAAVAFSITVGVLTLAILQAVFAATGNFEWASAFASVNKALEPLAMIASVVSLVTGLYGIFEAAKTAANTAATAAAKQAAIEAGTEFAADTVVNASIDQVLLQMIKTSADQLIGAIQQGAVDFVAGVVTPASLKFATMMAELLMLPSKLKIESLNSKNKDLKAEHERLMEETARESDVLAGFMQIYARPATADWSMYAEMFDLPYERVQGTMALGNIQRTSFQAIRRGVYTDPIFDGILGVKQGNYA